MYDTVVITFKNLASRPYNLHAIGVSYWKASEGESGHGHTLRVLALHLLLPGGGTSPSPTLVSALLAAPSPAISCRSRARQGAWGGEEAFLYPPCAGDKASVKSGCSSGRRCRVRG